MTHTEREGERDRGTIYYYFCHKGTQSIKFGDHWNKLSYHLKNQNRFALELLIISFNHIMAC